MSEPEPRHLTELRAGAIGFAGALAQPRSAEEVSLLVKACAAARIGIVPWGGGTGLVQGQVSRDGPPPLLISLERMNIVRSTYPLENMMIAEAGVTVQSAQDAARSVGRLYPLSLASEGSATVGGTLATNAGGLNVLRYGNARDLCLGLEVVMPDGAIWNGLKRLRKDNTGYDIKDLLIGAEGTLGIITAAALRLFPQPGKEATALIQVDGPAKALELLSKTLEMFGSSVSAFELISGQGLDFIAEALPEVRRPFSVSPQWLVLIDVEAAEPAEMLAELYEQAGLTGEALISKSEADREKFWNIRELIPEANRKIGSVLSNDISIPLSQIPEFMTRAEAKIHAIGPFRINAFGHLGDGNLHYNIFPPKGGRKESYADQKEILLRAINDLVAEYQGSFSAEHGIGRVKVGELERYESPVKLDLMRKIKQAFDPLGIMNPGAVLRA
ncbi:MAG: FAD-binding oxidoreductase [Deltaproteobacteria bacterium]